MLYLDLADERWPIDFPQRASDGADAVADVANLDPGATRVLAAVLNGGGPRYDFSTANGTVYLRRRASPPRD